jgi:fluoroacetyl-CoA thioesterase
MRPQSQTARDAMTIDSNQSRGALLPGRIGTATLIVAEQHTAPKLGSGRAPVFGSPAMAALIEAAAVACVEDQLVEGQETLGIQLDIEHIAATPVGLEVTATAELIEVAGRKLVFKVEARDAREPIGRGRHTRIIVDGARFRAKVAAKLQN